MVSVFVGQVRAREARPTGGWLLALEQGGCGPGAVPQACRCPASDSRPPARWLTPFSCKKEPPSTSFLQALGPLVWGSGQQWGLESLVPKEGASSPTGSLIQAPGSCAVALRQLFLAWSGPRPVPGRRSSSPGPLLALCPLPTPFLSRVSVGVCRAPRGGPRWAGVWLGRRRHLTRSVPSEFSCSRPCPGSGVSPPPLGSQQEPSQSHDLETHKGSLEKGERQGAGGWLHSQAGTLPGEEGPPKVLAHATTKWPVRSPRGSVGCGSVDMVTGGRDRALFHSIMPWKKISNQDL